MYAYYYDDDPPPPPVGIGRQLLIDLARTAYCGAVVIAGLMVGSWLVS